MTTVRQLIDQHLRRLRPSHPARIDADSNLFPQLPHRPTPTDHPIDPRDLRFDLEHLVAIALGLTRNQLLARLGDPVDSPQIERLQQLVERRFHHREPLAYIEGSRGFWSIDLEVSPDVLVPRPETELLVEITNDEIARLRTQPPADPRPHPLALVDACTGSGAVALAVACDNDDVAVWGTEISPEALAVARRNRDRLRQDAAHTAPSAPSRGSLHRTHLILASFLQPLTETHAEPAPPERLDLVVANPPYVARAEAAELAPELAHEPAIALFADDLHTDGDGLAAIHQLAEQSLPRLRPHGLFACEIGHRQGPAARALLHDLGFVDVELVPDLAGHHRVVRGRRPPAQPTRRAARVDGEPEGK